MYAPSSCSPRPGSTKSGRFIACVYSCVMTSFSVRRKRRASARNLLIAIFLFVGALARQNGARRTRLRQTGAAHLARIAVEHEAQTIGPRVVVGDLLIDLLRILAGLEDLLRTARETRANGKPVGLDILHRVAVRPALRHPQR